MFGHTVEKFKEEYRIYEGRKIDTITFLSKGEFDLFLIKFIQDYNFENVNFTLPEIEEKYKDVTCIYFEDKYEIVKVMKRDSRGINKIGIKI